MTEERLKKEKNGLKNETNERLIIKINIERLIIKIEIEIEKIE